LSRQRYIKLRDTMTRHQADKINVLKEALPVFSTMRSLAMRFCGVFRIGNKIALDDWIRDAVGSGIYAMQRFANKLRQEIDAVRNAISER
jgi:transposase